MTFQNDDLCRFYDDYDDEDSENRCRRCRKIAEPHEEVLGCQFCGEPIPSGLVRYQCADCHHEWAVRQGTSPGKQITCEECRGKVVGNCVACNEEVKGSGSRMVEENVVCNECYSQTEQIWCPVCENYFPYSGYLRFAFFGDRPGCHAAALVTHYRHEHRKSHDCAWQNPHYAAKIPGYDYEQHKWETNNQAKRQLIRSISRHLKKQTYPNTVPVPARDLIQAFERLEENDSKTDKLIKETMNKLGKSVG